METNEENYALIERIGQGAFGNVYRGLYRPEQRACAIKVLNLDAALDEIEDIQKEIAVLALCRCPSIVGFHRAFVRGPKLWIVMDLMVGSALDLYGTPHQMRPKKAGPFDEATAASFTLDVLHALAYLHRNYCIHRDLKSGNVLVGKDGAAKLADFGVSTTLVAGKKEVTSFAGTPHFMAPEVIQRQPYGTKADIWALGVTVIELVTGMPPYRDLDPARASNLIANNPPFDLPATFSAPIRDFVSQCMTRDPAKRPSAAQLLTHKFVRHVKRQPDALADRFAQYEKWRSKGGDSDSDEDPDDIDDLEREYHPVDINWDLLDDPAPDPPAPLSAEGRELVERAVQARDLHRQERPDGLRIDTTEQFFAQLGKRSRQVEARARRARGRRRHGR